MPKSINEALKILAYNDYFYADGLKTHINPHHKDRETVTSLAEAQYPWTEKQAKLAVVILKRYLSKFQKHKMDIKPLLDKPVYDESFRVIDFAKSIEKYKDEEEESLIDLKFPYSKKIVTLIRCLKNKKCLPVSHTKYNGESKIWTFKQTDVMTYYLTLIAIRYDFKFVDVTLLDDYYEVRNEKKDYKIPTAKLVGGEVIIENAPESMTEYWNKNLKDKKPLLQLDALKNLGIKATNINVEAETYTAKKIAEQHHQKLWIDKNEYSQDEIVAGLKELDCFPILMPVTGDETDKKDIDELWTWIKTFERNGINILKELSWGFDLKEPNKDTLIDFNKIDKETHDKMFELHQMSKQFKFIDQTTKVIFVRNRIPRSLIKSKIKPRASLITLGGGYYSAGTENLKRLLENLPKKLYYSDSQPSSWDWNDDIVIKL
jgi:hypothetical protein